MSDPEAKTVRTDVVLVGAGIMSATLGALLRLVESDWSITQIERLDGVAAESSDPWNNAGTGHSALCELNYTPQTADGDVDITKALAINEQFQVSRQFWANSVESLRRLSAMVTDSKSPSSPTSVTLVLLHPARPRTDDSFAGRASGSGGAYILK